VYRGDFTSEAISLDVERKALVVARVWLKRKNVCSLEAAGKHHREVSDMSSDVVDTFKMR
jgi:hypothetical protein